MNIKEIKKLIELVRKNDLAELKVSEKDASLQIVMNKAVPSSFIATATPAALSTQSHDAPQTEKATEAPVKKGHPVNSPMVGTVYLAPTPESPPFVVAGQAIKKGDTLCLVEAMKMFNRIESDRDGFVIEILVNNVQSVEYGQPLFLVS